MTITQSSLGEILRAAAHPLAGAAGDYDPLLEMIGDAQFVLIGEASHGTHEFYQARAEITRRLIVEKGFNAVAVEADWPDAYRVNCYARGEGQASASDQALGGFLRFPTWMWRNTVVLDFVDWLRAHNDRLPRDAPRVGFYGLDLYSMYTSITEVLAFLDKVDPEAARRARGRYACFERFEEDSQRYGYAASAGYVESCEDAVVSQLLELRRRADELLRRDGGVSEDELFYAEQNARLVKNAEAYYRTMFRGQVSSWNLRDRHMAETLDALVAHLSRRAGSAKVVVWAHNSHLGDARATQMGDYGEHNVGQLVRQRHGPDAVLVGFTTYTGTVTAASDWDGPAERKRVRPALPESYEATLHAVAIPNFLLNLRDDGTLAEVLRLQRLERAIGVIYLPQTERASHYFYARLPHQFDAVIHFDQTRAVEPLERVAPWTTGEPPETYPTSL
jgi:erythromycin esterase-like protein